MSFPTPTEVGWGGPQTAPPYPQYQDPVTLQAQFTRPDGTIDQAGLYAAMMANNALYNPEGDPSLGADVNFGYSGLTDQYGNTGTRHFTPEELALNGGAPMTFFTDPGQVWTTTDQQEIADRRDDQQTRMQQSAAQIAALIAGGTALTGGFSGGTAAGTTAPAYTGATTAAGLPTGAAAAAGGGVGTLSGAVPAVGASPGLVAGLGAAGTAGSGILDSSGAAIPGTEVGNALTGAGAMGGSFLENWLPYITGGINTLLGNQAAGKASDAEIAAMQAAIDEQRRQYDTTRADFLPWMTAGTGALNRLQDPTAFQASPGYEWLRSEGQRDIGNSFAARGGAASGNALRALSEFNTGLAQQEYGNWWNRQAGLAGVGQTATGTVANAGQNTASNVGNYLAGQGASRASGIAGRYGSLAQGLNDGVTNWLYRRRTA